MFLSELDLVSARGCRYMSHLEEKHNYFSTVVMDIIHEKAQFVLFLHLVMDIIRETGILSRNLLLSAPVEYFQNG